MPYEKQNFTDGMVLTAQHLNHMEEGIASAVPRVSADDAGKFLRVALDGSWVAESLTDVSEVGA